MAKLEPLLKTEEELLNSVQEYLRHEKQRLFMERWNTMTSKIPMKVVLPFLVVLVVIVSIMQFGPPKFIFILQTNRFEELPVTRTPTLVLVDSTGVAMGAILSHQKHNNESDEAKLSALNTESKGNSSSRSSSEQHLKQLEIPQNVKPKTRPCSSKHTKRQAQQQRQYLNGTVTDTTSRLLYRGLHIYSMRKRYFIVTW
ncbi:uncharacterized protein [Amphiura filiformis]|uniref:uncharacterized protein n=1 Tax=Amphiura filiformis TaxID=82378 RepID=UPI003B20CF4F